MFTFRTIINKFINLIYDRIKVNDGNATINFIVNSRGQASIFQGHFF